MKSSLAYRIILFHYKSNTAMHLSRRRKIFFFAERTLRPGDGER
jgi:hypothetical protein